ncbi:hypothetical protein DCO57_23220 [Labrenzia sp. 011]|nr:hypothetical protein DCO57_23220 [Labrenzia sp. 011]
MYERHEPAAAGETSGDSAPAPTPGHETSSASEKEPAQVEPEVQAEVQTQTAPEPATGNAGDDKPGPEESAEREIVLDLDDLIADTPPQATASPDQDEPAAAQDNTVSQDQSQTPAKEASSDEEPRDDQVRPAARPAPTLSEKNPIEEEMAKILDELGGQPN